MFNSTGSIGGEPFGLWKQKQVDHTNITFSSMPHTEIISAHVKPNRACKTGICNLRLDCKSWFMVKHAHISFYHEQLK